MNRKIVFFPLLMSLLYGCATHNTPLKDPYEQLIQKIPFGYVVKDKNYIPSKLKETVMMPEGQSAQDWNELLFTQIFLDKQDLTPEKYSVLMKTSWAKKCGDDPFLKNIESGVENGYSYSTFLIWCPLVSPDEYPAKSLFKVIKGNNGLYSIQQSYRTSASQAQINKSLEYLKSSIVCSNNTTIKCPNEHK